MSHTPTPWLYTPHAATIGGVIWHQFGMAPVLIASIYSDTNKSGIGAGETEANAAHIVRCVNAHDKLVAALRDLCERDWAYIGGDADTGNPDSLYSRVKRARAALAEAEAT